MTSSKSVRRETPTDQEEGAALDCGMDEFNHILARKLAQRWMQEQCAGSTTRSTSTEEDQTSPSGLTLPPELTPVGTLQFPAGVPEQEAGHAQKTIYPGADHSSPA